MIIELRLIRLVLWLVRNIEELKPKIVIEDVNVLQEYLDRESRRGKDE